MSPEDLREIQAFLTSVGEADLLSYLDVRRDAARDEIATVIQRKRLWAQAQQSNPKFRHEAIAFIRRHSLLRRALLDHRADYLHHLDESTLDARMQTLDLFISGAASSGPISDRVVEAVLRQARMMGIPEDRARVRLALRLSAEPTPAPHPHRSPSDETDETEEGLASASTRLAEAVRETIASGALPTGEVDRILIDGERRGLTPGELAQQLREGVARAQKPRPADQTEGNREHVLELVEQLRGLILQDLLNETGVRSLQRFGQRLGLEPTVLDTLLREVATVRGASGGKQAALAILGGHPQDSLEALGERYQARRRRARDLASQIDAALSCVRLDAAWATLRADADRNTGH